ncbi:DUF4124 domain-containing protein [Pseudoalteromonas sp. YIC-827]|uniref:DUF4124 domain-containing protein n=1 Tax=Pseudoalteromonas qingdaonensis TaxID=3131913 RepID=A0ABU9N044_9GAMM
MKYPILFAAALCLASLPSYATVYKCTINGVATFSQQPCGKDAQIIKVRYSGAKTVTAEGSEEEAPQQPNVSEVDSYLKSQEYDRRIAMHQRNISDYETRMAGDLAQLENMNQATANYLGSDSIADAKKQQATIVRANYHALIENEKKAISELQKYKENINAAAKLNKPL